jgi:hypothetical protein
MVNGKFSRLVGNICAIADILAERLAGREAFVFKRSKCDR